MKPSILIGLCLLPGCLLASDPKQAPAKAAKPMSTHIMVRATEAKWGDAPASLPAGAQAVVLSGDPGKPGNFTIRLKAPPGYRVPRHWHPTDESVTVIEGDFTLAMGDGADAHSADFGPGDFVLLPAKMLHEASTRNGVIVQINSTGPFQINYVNPADDPRKQMGAEKKAK
ncbi:cupin domain-containing protein [Lysobacter tyrosinilyticus]